MAYASANDSVVLTHDLDFSAILAATHGKKPSVVQIRADDVCPDVIGLQVRRSKANSFRIGIGSIAYRLPRPNRNAAIAFANSNG